MKKRILFILYLIGAPVVWLQAQKYTQLDSARGAYHAYRSCYDLLHYHLSLKVDPATRYISGSNRLSCKGIQNSAILQIDLDPAFEIDKMETSFGPAKWKRTGSSVLVSLPFQIRPGGLFWLEVHYKGHPHIASNPPWEGGFVWATDAMGIPWIGVACEGEGAGLWFPAKDHPADEPDSVLLHYEVPKNLVAVGNGRFLGKKVVSDSTALYQYKVTHPINHYNITFNAAAYHSWTDTLWMKEAGKHLKMSYYCLHEDLEKAKKQFPQSRQVIRTLGDLFGEYPFVNDGYALVQAPYRGMEHQSCIAYGEKFENNAFGFDFIVMHETGHEWWGNRTSADDHADMWIHESFCTYSEALFVEKMLGKQKAVEYLLAQKKKIRNKSPVQGPRDVFFNDWKDSDMYYKGTWMLHSLRYQVANDSIWFSALKQLGARIGFKPVSGEKLTDELSLLLKSDLKPFFAQYLKHVDWPVLEYFTESKEGKHRLHYRWNCREKSFSSAVPLLLNGTKVRLSATSEWNILEMNGQAQKVEPDEEAFLFRLMGRKD